MFEAIHDGRIKALWVMATNPAVSLPNAGRVREALERCPFVVVSDVMADTDTGRFAHVKLPALAWGEKDGTVTNSERMISRQRSIFDPPGEARADWWAVNEVGRRMGFEGFEHRSAAAVFAEHVRLTCFENDGARVLDLSSWAGCDYDRLEPRRWGGDRAFADGRFSTPSDRARLIAVTQRSLGGSAEYPMIVNNGRYRDQWHTMTRTGLSPRLSQHRREPLIEIHPEDAATLGLAEGDLAQVASEQGASIYRVDVSDGQRRGEVFVPIHWTDRTSSGGRTGMIPPSFCDPISGQPGFKMATGRITKAEIAWRGFLVARDELAAPPCLWWSRVRVNQGWLYELAGIGEPASQLERLLPEGPRAEAIDAARGTTRIAVMDAQGHLQCALYTTRGNGLPPRDWVIGELTAATPASPMALLAGRPAIPPPDRGAIVCVCFDVGMKTILSAIADQRLTNVAAVGEALAAGTNCGSCRPAIARLLEGGDDVQHAAI
jgi:assimilatory nitrate reductase catalytic subunit